MKRAVGMVALGAVLVWGGYSLARTGAPNPNPEALKMGAVHAGI
jgi:hypothetical protein